MNVRSDAVDVEQIMERIRARIREKRGVDYTEAEIKTLAKVKLEKIVDPKVVRSDLVEHYREMRPILESPLPVFPPRAPFPAPPDPPPPLPAPPGPPPPIYGFERDTMYVSSRGLVGSVIAVTRKLLNPIMKLFWNPTPLIEVLQLQVGVNRYLLTDVLPTTQSQIATVAQQFGLLTTRIDQLKDRIEESEDRAEGRERDRYDRDRARRELDALHFEVLNNMVVELTRATIEVRNMKMRLESLASRLEFDERRARALEGVVQYRTTSTVARPVPAPAAAPTPAAPEAVKDDAAGAGAAEDAAARQRRRRRRRRRGGGGGHGPGEGASMDADSGADTSAADGRETGSSHSEPAADRFESSERGGDSTAELPAGHDLAERVRPVDAPPAVDRSSEGSGEQ